MAWPKFFTLSMPLCVRVVQLSCDWTISNMAWACVSVHSLTKLAITLRKWRDWELLGIGAGSSHFQIGHWFVHSSFSFVSIPLVSLVYLRFHSVEQFSWEIRIWAINTQLWHSIRVWCPNGLSKKERNLCIASHWIGYHIPKRIKAYIYTVESGKSKWKALNGSIRFPLHVTMPMPEPMPDAFVLCSNLAYAYPICIWTDGDIL